MILILATRPDHFCSGRVNRTILAYPEQKDTEVSSCPIDSAEYVIDPCL